MNDNGFFKKEYLGKNIWCFLSDEHSFGTDALLLADFAGPKPSDKCCDLGSGCGIIPLIWCKKSSGTITAVEIQQKGFEQIERAIEFNGLSGRLTAVNSDLRDLKGKLEFGSYNLVTMNPPYTKAGAGIVSASGSDTIARHETMCTLEDICVTALKLLNFGGRLCMCIRPERTAELFFEMKKQGIEPKRLRFVSKRSGCKPWLALIEGRKGGKSGMTVENEFNIYMPGSDEYTDEVKSLYSDYFEAREQNTNKD